MSLVLLTLLFWLRFILLWFPVASESSALVNPIVQCPGSFFTWMAAILCSPHQLSTISISSIIEASSIGYKLVCITFEAFRSCLVLQDSQVMFHLPVFFNPSAEELIASVERVKPMRSGWCLVIVTSLISASFNFFFFGPCIPGYCFIKTANSVWLFKRCTLSSSPIADNN